MSTWVYLACIDHDPPLVSDCESGQHDERVGMALLVADRDKWLALTRNDDVEITDRWSRNGSYFLRSHPKCRLACVDEYNRWTDLGQGVPKGVKMHERPLDLPPRYPRLAFALYCLQRWTIDLVRKEKP